MADHAVTAGFIPLLDASILIVARELGFANAEGIDLRLVRETSWANIRDRMAIGHFDVAHMLAPMPIAANLGLTPFAMTMIAPMALGLGGNAITISANLAAAMGDFPGARKANEAGKLLRNAIAVRDRTGKTKLKFGVVHPHSSHNFELRYWLIACGIAPDRDVEIVILPPPFMVDALIQGDLDGYCVGEPWNSLAVEKGAGRILTTKQAIWASSPEKVLGVAEKWAEQHRDELAALLSAFYRAAQWCGDAANRAEHAALLAETRYLGLDAAVIAAALGGEAHFEPFDKAATFPWQSHALWFYSQMVRWNHVRHLPQHADIARRTYRPDIYRAAIGTAGGVVPAASAKVEGALVRPTAVGTTGGMLTLGPDGFFDGKIFDPDRLDDYLSNQVKN